MAGPRRTTSKSELYGATLSWLALASAAASVGVGIGTLLFTRAAKCAACPSTKTSAAVAVGSKPASQPDWHWQASCKTCRSAAAPPPPPPHRFSRKKEVAEREEVLRQARGGRGCSSPERTYRPLDVRVESSRTLCPRRRRSATAAHTAQQSRAAGQCKARSRTPPPSLERLRGGGAAGLANTAASACVVRTLGRRRARAAGGCWPVSRRRRHADASGCGDYNYTEISPTIEASLKTCVKLERTSWPTLAQEYYALCLNIFNLKLASG